jgi:hypothetical protein
LKNRELYKELVSVESQPTKEILAQTCTDVFFIRTVFDTVSATLLLRFRKKSGPPGKPPWTIGGIFRARSVLV